MSDKYRVIILQRQFPTWMLLSLLTLSLAGLMLLLSKPVQAALNPGHSAVDVSLVIQQVGWQQSQQSEKLQSARQAFSEEEYHLSHRLLEPLAKQGHAVAQYQLAMLYDTSHAVDGAKSMAVYWYRKAAGNGHMDAAHNLAVAYANGEGVEQNLSKAIKYWKRAARMGHTDAQYNLGIIFATGKGNIRRDVVEAAKWWRRAAIAGDAMAQYNLAALYANGVESVRSYCEATRWWERSAASGFTQASLALQVIRLKRDYNSCW